MEFLWQVAGEQLGLNAVLEQHEVEPTDSKARVSHDAGRIAWGAVRWETGKYTGIEPIRQAIIDRRYTRCMGEIPHTTAGAWPDEIAAGRFGATIDRAAPEGCRVAVLGLADDTGVALNGGRVGAAAGPDAIRSALARYGAAKPPHFDWPRVFDAGNVVPGSDIHETHDRVTAATASLLEAGLFPIGLGGGHDLTFPFVRAAIDHHGEPLTAVYLDAHLDVREETGSGMPFRKLVEECGVRELHVHGLDRYANSAEHLRWFRGHGGRVDPFGPTDPWPEGGLFMSIDLDAIDAAFAPGVSAPNPAGSTPGLVEAWARAAGRQPSVRCFDIMELNPAHDVDGRTAKVAARLLLAFLHGFTERSG